MSKEHFGYGYNDGLIVIFDKYYEKRVLTEYEIIM